MQAQLCGSSLRPAGALPRGRNVAMRPVAAVVQEVLEAAAPAGEGVPAGLNKYSSRITQPKSQGASQAMLYGTGLTKEDMDKPQARDGAPQAVQAG